MSLNKFTSSTDYLEKQYLNIGCNDIRCSSMLIKGVNAKASYFGTYAPTFTIDDGSTVQDAYAVYTFVGDTLGAVVDINVYCKMIVATSTASYNLSLNLPDNLKGYATKFIPATGIIHNKGGAYSSYNPTRATVTENSNIFTVNFNETTATQLPVGVGENFVNFNVKVEVKF